MSIEQLDTTGVDVVQETTIAELASMRRTHWDQLSKLTITVMDHVSHIADIAKIGHMHIYPGRTLLHMAACFCIMTLQGCHMVANRLCDCQLRTGSVVCEGSSSWLRSRI